MIKKKQQAETELLKPLEIQFAVDWVNVGVSPSRKVNHSHHPEKWCIKVTIIASKCENKFLHHNLGN
jgi:hypothetical protein